MWRYAWQLSGSEAEADDIVQGVFRKLLSKEAVLRNLSEYQLKAYIVVAIKNKAIDHHRQKKPCALPEDDVLKGKEKSPEEILFQRYEASRVRQALYSLSDKYRDTILSLYELDLSVSETADLLGISTDAVYKRRERALEKLKLFLGGEQDG